MQAFCKSWSGTVKRLTEVAEASVESRVTQTGSIGPVAAPIVGAVAFFIAHFPKKTLWTACTQDTNQHDIMTTPLKKQQQCAGTNKEAAHHPGKTLR